MTTTTATLRDKVAKDLGLKAVDEELSDELAATIEEGIGDWTAHYRELGLFWWQDNAIPDPCVAGLRMVMCALCCASVRKMGQGHEAKLEPGLAMIAALKPAATVDTLRTLYY
jgi:hypothetical protein